MPKQMDLRWRSRLPGLALSGLEIWLFFADPFHRCRFHPLYPLAVVAVTNSPENVSMIAIDGQGSKRIVFLPESDSGSMRPETSVWLMRDDDFIIGPAYRWATLPRMLVAYPWIWGPIYPLIFSGMAIWKKRKVFTVMRTTHI